MARRYGRVVRVHIAEATVAALFFALLCGCHGSTRRSSQSCRDVKEVLESTTSAISHRDTTVAVERWTEIDEVPDLRNLVHPYIGDRQAQIFRGLNGDLICARIVDPSDTRPFGECLIERVEDGYNFQFLDLCSPP
jgi:hypothetical protein